MMGCFWPEFNALRPFGVSVHLSEPLPWLSILLLLCFSKCSWSSGDFLQWSSCSTRQSLRHFLGSPQFTFHCQQALNWHSLGSWMLLWLVCNFLSEKKFPMPRISCWHQVAGLSKGLNYWVLNTVGPWVLGQNILFKTWSWAPLKILLWLHMMFDLKCWPFLTELEYIYILWVWRGTEGGVTSI